MSRVKDPPVQRHLLAAACSMHELAVLCTRHARCHSATAKQEGIPIMSLPGILLEKQFEGFSTASAVQML